MSVYSAGLTRREEVDAAIQGVQQGKLTPAELNYLNLYGDLHRNKLKLQEVSPAKLIYRA